MHAIVDIAGKQFRVTNNDKVKVPLLATKEGDKVSFDKVRLLEDDKGKITLGSPLVSNMAVGATVLKHDRDGKIIVFKKKRRKGYQKKNGHRQGYSLIEINDIGAAKSSSKKAVAEKPAPAKAETKPVKKAAPKTAKSATAKTVEPKKAPATKKATATKTAASVKPKVAKPKTTKSQAAAKKAEPKPKAKED
jgi:large subunit ribosomal protein L21